MTLAFADTSFYVAVISPRDRHHPAADLLVDTFSGQMLTSEYVLLELGSFFTKGKDRAVFLQFLEQLRRDEQTDIVWSDDELFEERLSHFAARPDKEWSLTDCLSFVIMQRMNIRDALTLDHHFEQAGFNIVFQTEEE